MSLTRPPPGRLLDTPRKSIQVSLGPHALHLLLDGVEALCARLSLRVCACALRSRRGAGSTCGGQRLADRPGEVRLAAGLPRAGVCCGHGGRADAGGLEGREAFV